MSKGLEALENLCNQCEFYQFEKGLRPKKCPFNKKCVFKERIEKELTELEEYKEADIKVCAGSLLTCTEDFAILWNEHKALEIIKEKRVNVGILIHHITDKYLSGLKSYNFMWGGTSEKQLTQEEYELLKEVVL